MPESSTWAVICLSAASVLLTGGGLPSHSVLSLSTHSMACSDAAQVAECTREEATCWCVCCLLKSLAE